MGTASCKTCSPGDKDVWTRNLSTGREGQPLIDMSAFETIEFDPMESALFTSEMSRMNPMKNLVVEKERLDCFKRSIESMTSATFIHQNEPRSIPASVSSHRRSTSDGSRTTGSTMGSAMMAEDGTEDDPQCSHYLMKVMMYSESHPPASSSRKSVVSKGHRSVFLMAEVCALTAEEAAIQASKPSTTSQIQEPTPAERSDTLDEFPHRSDDNSEQRRDRLGDDDLIGEGVASDAPLIPSLIHASPSSAIGTGTASRPGSGSLSSPAHSSDLKRMDSSSPRPAFSKDMLADSATVDAAIAGLDRSIIDEDDQSEVKKTTTKMKSFRPLKMNAACDPFSVEVCASDCTVRALKLFRNGRFLAVVVEAPLHYSLTVFELSYTVVREDVDPYYSTDSPMDGTTPPTTPGPVRTGRPFGGSIEEDSDEEDLEGEDSEEEEEDDSYLQESDGEMSENDGQISGGTGSQTTTMKKTRKHQRKKRGSKTGSRKRLRKEQRRRKQIYSVVVTVSNCWELMPSKRVRKRLTSVVNSAGKTVKVSVPSECIHLDWVTFTPFFRDNHPLLLSNCGDSHHLYFFSMTPPNSQSGKQWMQCLLSHRVPYRQRSFGMTQLKDGRLRCIVGMTGAEVLVYEMMLVISGGRGSSKSQNCSIQVEPKVRMKLKSSCLRVAINEDGTRCAVGSLKGLDVYQIAPRKKRKHLSVAAKSEQPTKEEDGSSLVMLVSDSNQGLLLSETIKKAKTTEEFVKFDERSTELGSYQLLYSNEFFGVKSISPLEFIDDYTIVSGMGRGGNLLISRFACVYRSDFFDRLSKGCCLWIQSSSKRTRRLKSKSKLKDSSLLSDSSKSFGSLPLKMDDRIIQLLWSMIVEDGYNPKKSESIMRFSTSFEIRLFGQSGFRHLYDTSHLLRNCVPNKLLNRMRYMVLLCEPSEDGSGIGAAPLYASTVSINAI